MSDDQRSAVSEALAHTLYAAPDRSDEPATLLRKLEARGVQALTSTELLSVIMGVRAAPAAARLLRHYGLARLSQLERGELARPAGNASGGVGRLTAALELHRRLVREEAREAPRFSRPADVFREVRELRTYRKEHLLGLYLDAQNDLVHRETLSVGSLNTTRTHPREILYPAIQHAALGFVLAHNHPSGSLEPSREDLEFTEAVRRAGALVGIELYDHLIVSRHGFTSLRERGLL